MQEESPFHIIIFLNWPVLDHSRMPKQKRSAPDNFFWGYLKVRVHLYDTPRLFKMSLRNFCLLVWGTSNERMNVQNTKTAAWKWAIACPKKWLYICSQPWSGASLSSDAWRQTILYEWRLNLSLGSRNLVLEDRPSVWGTVGFPRKWRWHRDLMLVSSQNHLQSILSLGKVHGWTLKVFNIALLLLCPRLWTFAQWV